MNAYLFEEFKESAYLAGEECKFSPGKQNHEFGLHDFLANKFQDDDDPTTIVVRALEFFCDPPDPRLDSSCMVRLQSCVF